MDAQGGFAYCLSLSIVIIVSLATVERQQSCEEQTKSGFFFSFFCFSWFFCRASSPSFLSAKSQFISGCQTCAYLNRD
jgi:hypothetical protein